MSSHNNTYYTYSKSISSILHPSVSQCMSLMRSTDGIVSLIVKMTDLNHGLTREDVFLWNKLGNESMFPAVITEGYSTFMGLNDIITRNLRKNLVSFKLAEGHRRREDAKHCIKGTLDVITPLGGNKYDGYLRVTEKLKGGYCFLGGQWGVSGYDFVTEDTGQTLNDYARDFMDKFLAEENEEQDNRPNAYIISIDSSKIKNRQEKLAVLTFYRYLWSNVFRGLVRDALIVYKSGIPAWESIMLAHAAERDSSYNNYYGLTQIRTRSIPSIEEVKIRLNRDMATINNSFTTEIVNVINRFTIKEGVDYTETINTLKKADQYPKRIECVNAEKTTTLHKGSFYDVVSHHGEYVTVVASDYCKREYSKTRFK